ncbi:MAG TPA: ATP-binding protein [Stellaceae bacterium]|nr:ATP-binding protein [Stellaceae bacterium]
MSLTWKGKSCLRISLRWRLIVLVLLALMPALIFFVRYVHVERDQLIGQAQGRALRLARAWAGNHDTLVREAELLLEAARRDPALTGATPGDCAEALRRLVASVHWPSEVDVVDRNGIVLCGSGAEEPRHSPPMLFVDDLFASRVLEISEFQLDGAARSLAFAGRRLAGASDRAVVAAIDLAEIQRRTEREAEGAQYDIMVIGRNGRLLARDPEAAGLVGTPIGAEHPLMPGLMVKTEGVAAGRGRDGVERLFAFTQLPQTGAKISVGLAREDILGVAERNANRQLAMLAAVAALALAGAWLLGEFSVMRWARALGRAADAFARGDLSHRVVLSPAAGEFATLGDAFNRMATTIEARTAALAASERRFRDIAEVAGDFFWERDAAGRFTFLSDRFTEVTGMPAAELIGKSAGGMARLVSVDDDATRLDAALSRHRPFRNLDLRLTMPSGEIRWWRVSGKPFFDPTTGVFLGFRGAGSEVTAATVAEQELRVAKEAAEAANIAKSEFLATMSHELRTPLNAVIGFSEIMQQELLGPMGVAAYRDYAGDIMQSGQHLLAMINDILDFAKIDAGSLRLSEETVDLVALAARAARAIEPQARAAGIAVAVKSAVPALAVSGDERRLHQVLLNLVSNAVKFTPKGGRIDIELHRDAGGETQLVVRDTGIGIAAEDLPRVVEPFHQVDSGHARRHEGTGLGLAICDRLVRLHGGRLLLASTLGQGTTVTVTLPAARGLPGEERAVAQLQALSRKASR